MADTAAFLVDHVIPAAVPVRQWLLWLPYRVRLLWRTIPMRWLGGGAASAAGGGGWLGA